MARACAASPPPQKRTEGGGDPPGASDTTAIPSHHKGSTSWRRRAQLEQTVETIDVASPLYGAVLDDQDIRRGGEFMHELYSSKVALLGDDYLLARASVLLVRLENTAAV